MNEAELAEKFNAELDAVLNGAAPAAFGTDPGAMALAARFAAADFSAESLIRDGLRERMTARPGAFAVLRALFSNNYARAAFAAAALVLAMLPALRRPAAPPAPVPPVTAALPQPARPAPPAARPARRAAPADDGGIFASLPMPALEPRRIDTFPIGSAGRMRIAVTQGREVSVDGGSGIVWETEGGVFVLERRAVAPGELFEVRTL
ncbi:MAG: hypothetical protein ACYC2I_10215 [Elusimicrobiales bacterium]